MEIVSATAALPHLSQNTLQTHTPLRARSHRNERRSRLGRRVFVSVCVCLCRCLCPLSGVTLSRGQVGLRKKCLLAFFPPGVVDGSGSFVSRLSRLLAVYIFYAKYSRQSRFLCTKKSHFKPNNNWAWLLKSAAISRFLRLFPVK